LPYLSCKVVQHVDTFEGAAGGGTSEISLGVDNPGGPLAPRNLAPRNLARNLALRKLAARKRAGRGT
jgi:hypothetical protein